MLIPVKDKERFFSKIKKSNSCWLWQGGRWSQGYGRFKSRGIDLKAHRISYSIYKGEIQNGLLVCHYCDNPPCVNPDHLFLGTNKQNTQDMLRKGRHSFTGSMNPKAKLKDQDIIEIRRMILEGIFQKEIGRKFNVSQATISDIKLRSIWKHVK